MENVKEQFARLYMELDLTDDQASMIKKLQRDVDAALRQPPAMRSVCCNEELVRFKSNNNNEAANGTKLVLGDALDQLVINQLVIKIDQLIKDEEKYNPKQLDECSWNYQVGILITANEAKLLLKVLDEMKMFHLKTKADEKHRR